MTLLSTYLMGINGETLRSAGKIWDQAALITGGYLAINQTERSDSKEIPGKVSLGYGENGVSLEYVSSENILGFKIGDKPIPTNPFNTLVIEDQVQGAQIQIINQDGATVEHNLDKIDQGRVALFAGTLMLEKFVKMCARKELGLDFY